MLIIFGLSVPTGIFNKIMYAIPTQHMQCVNTIPCNIEHDFTVITPCCYNVAILFFRCFCAISVNSDIFSNRPHLEQKHMLDYLHVTIHCKQTAFFHTVKIWNTNWQEHETRIGRNNKVISLMNVKQQKHNNDGNHNVTANVGSFFVSCDTSMQPSMPLDNKLFSVIYRWFLTFTTI